MMVFAGANSGKAKMMTDGNKQLLAPLVLGNFFHHSCTESSRCPHGKEEFTTSWPANSLNTFTIDMLAGSLGGRFDRMHHTTGTQLLGNMDMKMSYTGHELVHTEQARSVRRKAFGAPKPNIPRRDPVWPHDAIVCLGLAIPRVYLMSRRRFT